jgi:hypothetical protein
VDSMDRKILAIIVALLIMVGGIVVMLYMTMPFSQESKKEIWLPHRYHIANIPKGFYIYIEVSEYRNDEAVEISFMDMQKQYEIKFSNETFEIIVQKNGTIHYVWTFEGIIFTAKQHNNLWYPGHYGSIIGVSGNGQLTILYQADILPPVGIFIIMCIIGVIGGYLIWPSEESN